MKKALFLLPVLILASCNNATNSNNDVKQIVMKGGTSATITAANKYVAFQINPLLTTDPVHKAAASAKLFVVNDANLTLKTFDMTAFIGTKDYIYKTSNACADLPGGTNNYHYELYDGTGVVIKTETMTVTVNCS